MVSWGDPSFSLKSSSFKEEDANSRGGEDLLQLDLEDLCHSFLSGIILSTGWRKRERGEEKDEEAEAVVAAAAEVPLFSFPKRERERRQCFLLLLFWWCFSSSFVRSFFRSRGLYSTNEGPEEEKSFFLGCIGLREKEEEEAEKARPPLILREKKETACYTEHWF